MMASGVLLPAIGLAQNKTVQGSVQGTVQGSVQGTVQGTTSGGTVKGSTTDTQKQGEAKKDQKPPPAAQGKPACIQIANLTEHQWPIEILRFQRARSIIAVKARQILRYCTPDALKPDEVVIVRAKSTWLPIGECKLRDQGTMEIERYRDPDVPEADKNKVTCK